MGKYLIAWLPMVLIGIANGVLREFTYGRFVGELTAHQLSTGVALVLFGVYVWLVVRVWPPVSTAQSVRVGIVWLVLTVAFEFLFGHYVVGHAWARLLHDYNLLAGRVWALVLIWIAAAPVVFTTLARSARH